MTNKLNMSYDEFMETTRNIAHKTHADVVMTDFFCMAFPDKDPYGLHRLSMTVIKYFREAAVAPNASMYAYWDNAALEQLAPLLDGEYEG